MSSRWLVPVKQGGKLAGHGVTWVYAQQKDPQSRFPRIVKVGRKSYLDSVQLDRWLAEQVAGATGPDPTLAARAIAAAAKSVEARRGAESQPHAKPADPLAARVQVAARRTAMVES